MNLNKNMQKGISNIMKTAGRFYLSNAKGRKFLLDMLPAMQKSAAIRHQQEENGLHVPPFLIASVASQCNLHCHGCYARAAGSCGSSFTADELNAAQWRSVFTDANRLGVSFILLAGGEPLLRRDILAMAADFPHMIFPVFTNGTLLDSEAMQFFDDHRNLIPVLSIEGNEAETDMRRGKGTYNKIRKAMYELSMRKILYGTSITVTSSNLSTVSSHMYVSDLYKKGCGLIFYVEYVPTEAGTESLVLREEDLHTLKEITQTLKQQFSNMVILSFPGDEQAMGGCLASGRGFFHIGPSGDAEPCPFAAYSKMNLKTSTMQEVLASDFFSDLRAIAKADGTHDGGCTLFHHREEIEALVHQ